MSLKDLNLKKSYDSDEDDILRDFYIPSLSESIKYKRLAGFFSSTSLAVAAKGISNFIKNHGKMKLVVSAKLNKKDVEVIKKAEKNPKVVLEEKMNKEISDIDNEFIKDHVSALGWMVANGKLDIKVAVIVDEDGNPVDKETVRESGIFHPKVGILEDEEGNKVSFSGGINETRYAWLMNVDEIKVFRDWKEGERGYLDDDIKRFEKFWKGKTNRTEIMSVPKATEEKLIEMAPENIDNLENLDVSKKSIKKRKGSNIKKIKPWKIQKDACDKWFENNKRGIFHMATGTGKTIAALTCLKRLQEEAKKVVTIITAPKNHLLKQWIKSMKKYDTKGKNIIADGSHPNWEKNVEEALIDFKLGKVKNLHILTTHTTFPKEKFKKRIRNYKGNFLLIADEMHGLGTSIRRRGLLEKYNFRLGLSATPERHYSEEQTNFLFNYFGNVVKKFTLKDAIKKVNPDTGKPYLSSYDYKIRFVDMVEDEFEEYQEKTKKARKAYYSAKDEEEREEKLNALLAQKASVVKTAEGKYKELKNILEEINDKDHTIIFCHHGQRERVREIVKNNFKSWHWFTEKQGTKPEANYNGLSERGQLLKRLSNGDLQVLLAMGCLDEGVDVPAAKRAILMSSSGNPRQYVQRRGRVLRQCSNKTKATIYDILVIPGISDPDQNNLNELEEKIIKKEIDRAREFIVAADNVLDCMDKIEKLEKKYKMDINVL